MNVLSFSSTEGLVFVAIVGKCSDYSVAWKIISIFRKLITHNSKIWSPKLVLVYPYNFLNEIFNFRSLWRVSVATMFIIVGSRKLTSVDDIRPSPTPPKDLTKVFLTKSCGGIFLHKKKSEMLAHVGHLGSLDNMTFLTFLYFFRTFFD